MTDVVGEFKDWEGKELEDLILTLSFNWFQGIWNANSRDRLGLEIKLENLFPRGDSGRWLPKEKV